MKEDSARRIELTDNFYKHLRLNTDHRELVRFNNALDQNYLQVRSRIEELVAGAPKVVRRRLLARNLRKNEVWSSRVQYMNTDLLPQGLTPEQHRLWTDLNRPPYSAFRNSDRLAKPERKTLQWLIGGESTELDRNPQPWLDEAAQAALCKEDFIAWRDPNRSGSLLVTGPPGQGMSVLSNLSGSPRTRAFAERNSARQQGDILFLQHQER